jgi:hypothetical protein
MTSTTDPKEIAKLWKKIHGTPIDILFDDMYKYGQEDEYVSQAYAELFRRITDFSSKPYKITGEWETELTGEVKLNERDSRYKTP